MPKRHYNNWLEAYQAYARFSEAPSKFHFWTAVGTVAGALRRRVWIDQAYFQWTPNMYIIFVAPPGIVSKSTTANIGMRLLKQIPDIHFGPDAVTWQSLTESLAESTEEVLLPGTDLYLPMSCITIASSEFGTFLNPNDREMVDVMVSLWDGQIGTWEKRTKTQGSDLIVNPWINMIACTTPAWIAGNFPDYMIGGGFTSRCVFVYAEEKRQLVAYPGDHVPTDIKELEKTLVHDLEIISQICGEYRLSKEAVAFGEEWYQQHYYDTQNAIDSKAVGYRARKQTHVHKLSMVIAASKRDELVIEKEDLQEAIELVTDLEAEMPKVFSLIGRTDGARHTETVLQVVARSGVVDEMMMIRVLATSLAKHEIDAGLNTCIAAGYVTRSVVGTRTLLTYTGADFTPDQGEASSQASLKSS